MVLYCKKEDTIRRPEVVHRQGRNINGPRHFEAGHGAGLSIRQCPFMGQRQFRHSEVVGRAEASYSLSE